MAITLNVNRFLGTLTNLIAYSQVADTAERGNMSKLVDSCRDINVDNGDGKVILSANLPAVSDLSGQSSLLTSKPPEVDEQYVSVTNFKVIQMTINRYLVRGAFVDETQMATFVAYLLSIMRTAKEAFIYKQLVNLIASYVPTQSSQTVTIDIIDTSTLADPAQLNQANIYNANKIQKEFIRILNEMGAPTDKFNDNQFTEVIDLKSLNLFVKGNTNNDIIVDSLAFLLNSNKITEEQKWNDTIVIPNGQFEEDEPNTIAWLAHKKKFQHGSFYEVATSFFDASTLNQSDWLHFAYYLGIIDAYPAVKFVINKSIQPSALAQA